eukprot:TRINITY_DN2998_c0_g3_i3.p1 TRINITY_DN2998_c0_g3~~TRINITY_DN2998_c0_g3_i3.p1  ORF type:complete len:231 (+),score=71.53 TRINITY_DN2998_c0_g3_i3:848-1540(+)
MDLNNMITKEVVPRKKVFKAKSKSRARLRLIQSQAAPSRMTFGEWTKLTSSKASIEMEKTKREEREKCGGCEKKIKKSAAVCSLCHRRFCRDCKYFQEVVPIEKHKASSIPETAFGRNDYEKKILIDYLEKKQWNLVYEFKKKLKEMQTKKWKYKDATNSLVTLKVSDTVCKKCFDIIWGDMLYRYRESLNSAMPETVKKRPKCWFGRECTAQARDLDHAKKYNHICEKK